MDIKALHSHFLNSTGVTTDTRSIEAGKIFFALKGENFNGNKFALQALEKGAVYALIDEPQYANDSRCLLVDDVLAALQALAKHHRETLDLTTIAITGSNGKTTTKELMRDVLQKKFKTLATLGNLNNHIGVPLTLLMLDEQHAMAIIEMGASHLEEIALLSQITTPDYGLITNIGVAHIGEFGGRANIVKAKCELFDHLRAHKATAIVDGGSSILMEKSADIERVIYGAHPQSETNVKLISADPYLVIEWNGREVKTQLIGDYNLQNITAAIATGVQFDVAADDICDALEAYAPDNNRSQLINRGTTRIIMDAYNANPDSMKVALTNLSQMKAEKKLAILGDMLELGEESEVSHRELINLAASLGIESIYVGKEMMAQRAGKPNFYSDSQSAMAYLGDIDLNDTLVLIKGSRGIRLEQLLEVI